MYILNSFAIFLMYGLASAGKTNLNDFDPFFGDIPKPLLTTLLILDVFMMLAVLIMYRTIGMLDMTFAKDE